MSTKPISNAIKKKALSLIRTPSAVDHKGSSGRIVVIGGSRDYSGAPYFAATSALRAGADMVTVVTTASAMLPIKSMSPDLIVRGLIPSPSGKEEGKLNSATDAKRDISDIQSVLQKSHSLIIGPGLATDTEREVDAAFVQWLETALVGAAATSTNADASTKPLPPTIIDASGIPLFATALAQRHDALSERSHNSPLLILTPNVNELETLYKAAVLHETEERSSCSKEEKAIAVSRKMHCCVVAKGEHDYIAAYGKGFGAVTLGVNETEGEGKDDAPEVRPCPRRSAGQGDIMSGLVGTFLAWDNIAGDASSSHTETVPREVYCAVAASLVIKHSALATEASMKTSRFLTSDILAHIAATVDSFASDDKE